MMVREAPYMMLLMGAGLTDSTGAVPSSPHLVESHNPTLSHDSHCTLGASSLQNTCELSRQFFVPTLLVANHVKRNWSVLHLQT